MGRRSNFQRIPKDAYDTPPEALLPLLPYLSPGTRFIEPCGGRGALVEALEAHGQRCVYSCDIAPRALSIVKRDALDLVGSDVLAVDMIITNPPWTRKLLHPLIDHFRQLRPTWLLFDAAWAHTQQAAPFLRFCSQFVTVGRVKWIPDTSMTAKDDAAWFRFDAFETQTVFIGKSATDEARAASPGVSAPALSLARSADCGHAGRLSATPPKLTRERQKEFAACHGQSLLPTFAPCANRHGRATSIIASTPSAPSSWWRLLCLETRHVHSETEG